MRRRVVVPHVMHFSHLNVLEPLLCHMIGWVGPTRRRASPPFYMLFLSPPGVGLKPNSSTSVAIKYLASKFPAKNTTLKKIILGLEIKMGIVNNSTEYRD